MQRVSRLVAVVLHCMHQSAYMHNIEAVVAQELKTLVLAASLPQRVWCAIKA